MNFFLCTEHVFWRYMCSLGKGDHFNWFLKFENNKSLPDVMENPCARFTILVVEGVQCSCVKQCIEASSNLDFITDYQCDFLKMFDKYIFQELECTQFVHNSQ